MIPHVPTDESPARFAPFVHELRLIADIVLYGNGDSDWDVVLSQESAFSPADHPRYDRFVIRTRKWIRRNDRLFRIEVEGSAEKGRSAIVVGAVRFPVLPGDDPVISATDLIVDQA